MNTTNCPNCGAENEADDLFCVDCGQRLDESGGRSPPPRPSRRFFARILLLLLLVGLTAVVYGVASQRIPFPFDLGWGKPAKNQSGNETSFLVLITPGERAPEVILTDLDGDLLAEVGSVTGMNEPSWGFSTAASWLTMHTLPIGLGAGAWAWPEQPVALIALGTLNGVDLLRVNIETDEVVELARDATSLSIQGFVQQDLFVWQYTQKSGENILLAVTTNGSQIIEFIESSDPLDFALSPDARHLFFRSDEAYVADTEGAFVHRLGPAQNGAAFFSYDDRTLFYSTGHQLIRAGADGRNSRIITEVGRKDRIIPIAIGDGYLVALQEVEDRQRLKVLTWDGEITANIKCPLDAGCIADFLPNDRELAIVTLFQDSRMEVDLANSDGAERRPLAKGRTFSRRMLPILVGGGRYLAVTDETGDGLAFLLYDTKKRKTITIDSNVDEIAPLASSKRYLVYAVRIDEDWTLMAAALPGGETWEIDSGAALGYPAAFFLPDGQSIVYEARADVLQQAIVDHMDNYFGSVSYPQADIYRTPLQNPDPKRIYPEAGLLAASLYR